MKRIITAALLGLYSCAPAPVAAESKIDEACISIGELAHTVMVNRQGGVPISKMLPIATEDFIKAIVLDAYRRPLYSSDEYKERAINEFESYWVTACYAAFE